MTQTEKGYAELRSRIDFSLLEGTKYVAGHYFGGTADATTVSLFLENPSDTGKAIITQPPIVRAGKRVDSQLDFNPTVDTQGTEITIHNRRSDITNGSVAVGYYGGSYTLNDPFDSVPVGADTGSKNTYASTDEDTAFVIASGESALLQATTQNSDTDIRLSFDYIELPEEVLV